ncbi:MAG: hypothetical protein HY049_04090 [Acidobacteria bacterium]|nr:hypothetical protein [Acidobacteriota bacterium]
MSSRMRVALIGLLALGAGVVTSRVAVTAAASSEEEDFRQIKSDVFDEKWESVLADCDRLIAAFPGSGSLPRTYYYRAKALHHLPGKEEMAISAYGEFIDKFPAEAVMREDALISRINLAKSLWLQGRRDNINILLKALDEKGYPRIYSAIQISHLDNKPAKARALPVLQDCARREADAEVRNECTLGILRIDPNEVPRPGPQGSGTVAEPRLIRLEVRDKKTGSITVAVNLPVAFAEALLGSLSQIDRGRVTDELRVRHIDLDNLMKSLKSLGRQTLVEVETEEARIKVWLE